MPKPSLFHSLQKQIDGELFTDNLHKHLFATDASVYREIPLGVIYPRHGEDVERVVQFANQHNLSIIPRAAGTSLAGQVVGKGLVVDCSKYMNNILEINKKEGWVRLQPGVVLDELNQQLEPHGLFFGPETSTSTHCTVGGMFGNNSCGTHSIIYQSVREHILEARVVLSNGESATITHCNSDEFKTKKQQTNFEGEVYKGIYDLLKYPRTQELIQKRFPPKRVIRRNTGYALDFLVDTEVFSNATTPLNLCKLLAGSEGTLAYTTEMKLNLVPVPPPHKAVVCVHHESLAQSCAGNLIALDCSPTAVELMDDIIIKMARENPIQREQSKFIKGLPKAVLLVEFMEHSKEKLEQQIHHFLSKIEQAKLSYHHAILYHEEVKKVWNLRKAGLGVLGNMVGDKKPVAVVEDTAVAPEVLPEYVAEFEQLMHNYNKECVFYAHISAGELHLRPVLNLKEKNDRQLFRKIGEDSARLVAKYNGSISGEHGDGRVRGEFIPIQYGEEILKLFKKVKHIFDPHNIFNPDKIVDTPPMDEFLRYEENQETKEFDTVYDFSNEMGMLRAAEKCNGVGFCRKTEKIGGTMCPSFQATRNEKETTRARANTLREILTTSSAPNPFADPEISEVLDLCLSCKACKSECPSSVDMAKLKAEALYQKYQSEGIPFATKLIAESPRQIKRFQFASPVMNWAMSLPLTKKVMGIARERDLPKIASSTLTKWHKPPAEQSKDQTVYLFADEFSNFYQHDQEIGKTTIRLLEKLGHSVQLFEGFSARTHLSKGLLGEAKEIAEQNVNRLHDLLGGYQPLIGMEPSTILAFRDEYIDLLRGEMKQKAKQVAEHCFTLEEFLSTEITSGNIQSTQFQDKEKKLAVHGHCQQKALIGNEALINCLSVLPNATIQKINSGCCGMAGSFGYEKTHYKISQQIGELVLFPAVRDKEPDEIIVAPGTSCRHQIMDGTGTKALHPSEVLYQYLK